MCAVPAPPSDVCFNSIYSSFIQSSCIYIISVAFRIVSRQLAVAGKDSLLTGRNRKQDQAGLVGVQRAASWANVLLKLRGRLVQARVHKHPRCHAHTGSRWLGDCTLTSCPFHSECTVLETVLESSWCETASTSEATRACRCTCSCRLEWISRFYICTSRDVCSELDILVPVWRRSDHWGEEEAICASSCQETFSWPQINGSCLADPWPLNTNPSSSPTFLCHLSAGGSLVHLSNHIQTVCGISILFMYLLFHLAAAYELSSLKWSWVRRAHELEY